VLREKEKSEEGITEKEKKKEIGFLADRGYRKGGWEGVWVLINWVKRRCEEREGKGGHKTKARRRAKTPMERRRTKDNDRA